MHIDAGCVVNGKSFMIDRGTIELSQNMASTPVKHNTTIDDLISDILDKSVDVKIKKEFSC